MAKKVTPKSSASAVPAAAAPAIDAPKPVEAMKATKAAKPKAVAAPDPAPATQPLLVTDQMIAERAYHKWANGEPGDHHHHWVTAERELRGNG